MRRLPRRASARRARAAARNRRAPWASRLESRLVAGDAPGSWSVIEAAMASGAELDEIYLDVLTPAMVAIGERWAAGELDVSIEHRATGIAMRIVGRIGPRFSRRGRSRGVVALGAPAGEYPRAAVAMLGDLLRLRGWDVSDFGVDVPSESLAHVISQTPDLVAVGLSAMSSDNLGSLADACAAVHVADPSVLVVVGGHAVARPRPCPIARRRRLRGDRPRHGRRAHPPHPGRLTVVCRGRVRKDRAIGGGERTCVR